MQVTVTSEVTDAEAREVFQVYDAVFGEAVSVAAWLEEPFGRHAARHGFRLARAHKGSSLVGFAWGYTGENGQWFTDNAAAVLPAEVAETWLGGHFEVVELAVLPEFRGQGVGRALMVALTDQLPHERLVLMTSADEADPARRLYQRLGWEIIGPGLHEAAVILGLAR